MKPGTVRIIAGRLRGSRLAVPELPGLRPTADRVRETLFNWLQDRVAGARCLDLFAGSGALGFEAASRGAAEVWMVERDRQLCARLRAEAERLKVPEARIECADALAFLDRPTARPFDLVFLDPPFAANLHGLALERLAVHGWLAPDARVYIEAPLVAPPPMPAGWERLREGRTREVTYALYRADADRRPDTLPAPSVPAHPDPA